MVAADLTLRLDMKDRQKGASILPLAPDMVGAPFGVTVVQVEPAEIHVTLVPRPGPAPPSA